MARDKLRGLGSVVVQIDQGTVKGKEKYDVDLAVLGSLAEQVHELTQRGLSISVVVSGSGPLAGRVSVALSTLLSLKGDGSQVSSSEDGTVLAAAAASAKQAQLLVYLSHVPGLPAPHVRRWLTQIHDGPIKGGHGVLPTYRPEEAVTPGCTPGQELTTSAWQAAQSGLTVVVAGAAEPHVLERILAGEVVGTLFDVEAAAHVGGEQARASTSTGAASVTPPPPAATQQALTSSRDLAVRARAASRRLQALSGSERAQMLNRVADALVAHQDEILAENAKDVQEAQGRVADALLQRLVLAPRKIAQLADGIRAVGAAEEPLGRIVRRTEVAEGLVLDKVTAPLGVVLIIFEARPDALPQIASLAVRSGNGLLLKGGKEAARSNTVLHRVIVEALGPLGPDLIGLIQTREEIDGLLALDDVIDLVIPRGGNALVSHIQRSTRIPVLGHADGVCHIYVDEEADLNVAIQVLVDAKVDYPAACNAAEKVLVHQSWTQNGGLESILASLSAAGVTVHGGPSVSHLGLPAPPAPRHEYGSLDISLEVVGSLGEAVDHIHAHGSSHTDCIITRNQDTAEAFMRAVDSACVFHNASTRFADGFRFGLGAEVGISTSRIHARGPVGVEGLLTSKWLLRGNGHIVKKDSAVTYTHKALPIPQQAA